VLSSADSCLSSVASLYLANPFSSCAHLRDAEAGSGAARYERTESGHKDECAEIITTLQTGIDVLHHGAHVVVMHLVHRCYGLQLSLPAHCNSFSDIYNSMVPMAKQLWIKGGQKKVAPIRWNVDYIFRMLHAL
jgi:hypothetical protein